MPGDEPLRLGVTVLRADADDVDLRCMIPSELLEAGGFPGAVRSMRGPEPVQRRPLGQPQSPQAHVPSGGDVTEQDVGHDGPGRRTRPGRGRGPGGGRRGRRGRSRVAPSASSGEQEHQTEGETAVTQHRVTVLPPGRRPPGRGATGRGGRGDDGLECRPSATGRTPWWDPPKIRSSSHVQLVRLTGCWGICLKGPHRSQSGSAAPSPAVNWELPVSPTDISGPGSAASASCLRRRGMSFACPEPSRTGGKTCGSPSSPVHRGRLSPMAAPPRFGAFSHHRRSRMSPCPGARVVVSGAPSCITRRCRAPIVADSTGSPSLGSREPSSTAPHYWGPRRWTTS